MYGQIVLTNLDGSHCCVHVAMFVVRAIYACNVN